MRPIKYETWQMLKRWIADGADTAAAGAALLFSEIPIIGPLIGGGLIKLLGWSLNELLDYLPHENEPRGDTLPMASLHLPGYQYYVASPNMYGGDAERARAASLEAQLNQGISMGDPAKIADAQRIIAAFKNKTGITNITDLTQGNPTFKKDETTSSIPLSPLTVPSTSTWNSYYAANLKIPKIGVAHISGPSYYNPKYLGITDSFVANPTWGRAGFA